MAIAQPTSGPLAPSIAPQSPSIDRLRLDGSAPRTAQPPVTTSPQPPSVAAPAATVSSAKITRVRCEGSTLPADILARAVQPFVGAPLDRQTLQNLANALTATYAKSGIALYSVTIPTQDAAGGVIRVAVTEGWIGRYAIRKTTSSTPEHLIAAQLKPLLHDRPTHKPVLERSLWLLRDTPGQKVQANLRTTQTPGKLALDLDIQRKQVEVTLNVNNRGVVNVVTGIQAQVVVAVNGLLREGDSTSVSAYVPLQPSRYQFYSASHATPIDGNGTTLSLSAAYVRTKTRAPEVRGEAKQAGIAIAHPLIRSNKRNLTVSASADAMNSDNYFLDTAFGGSRTRALRAGLSWSVAGAKDGYAVAASVSQGIDALGARPARGYSDVAFRKANVQITAVKQLGRSLTVRATLRGQYTADRLPTTERFAMGGEGAGIAYRYGVYTVDKALAGSFEVARRIGPAKSKRAPSLFVFADAATGRSFARPAYGLPANTITLASAGGGIRIMPVKGWSLEATAAAPVDRPSARFSRKARFFFSVTRII